MKTKNNDTNQKLRNKYLELLLLLAIVGGFLETYTYICRGGVFANAQTGNVALLAVSIANGNLLKATNYIWPIISFGLGVVIVEFIKDKSTLKQLKEWEKVIFIIEIIVLFLIGFVPKTAPHSIVNVTISFISGIQSTAFRKLVDAPYSSTMTTGNLRVACLAIYESIVKKDDSSKRRARTFLAVIGCFFLGTFLGATATIYIGVKAIWINVIFLIICISIYNKI